MSKENRRVRTGFAIGLSSVLIAVAAVFIPALSSNFATGTSVAIVNSEKKSSEADIKSGSLPKPKPKPKPKYPPNNPPRG